MTKTIEQRAKEIGDAPAFPFVGDTDYMGMTYLQWLVGQSLAGIARFSDTMSFHAMSEFALGQANNALIALAEMEAKNG